MTTLANISPVAILLAGFLSGLAVSTLDHILSLRGTIKLLEFYIRERLDRQCNAGTPRQSNVPTPPRPPQPGGGRPRLDATNRAESPGPHRPAGVPASVSVNAAPADIMEP